MQAIFRNPLAEPYLLGLSSGGALGAVLALAAGMTVVTWPALAGSLLIAGLVLLLCRRRIAADLPSLLLAGVALGALAQAFTTAIILRFDPGALRSILFWLMGSFAGRGWAEVWLLLPAASAGRLLVLALHRPLDLLALGGESAHHLGVRVRLLQTGSIALAAVLAALTVAACGTIGFVGLMAPHLARRLAGAPHARVRARLRLDRRHVDRRVRSGRPHRAGRHRTSRRRDHRRDRLRVFPRALGEEKLRRYR